MSNLCYVWNSANCEYVKTFNPATTEKDAYDLSSVHSSVDKAKMKIRECRDPELAETPEAIFECERLEIQNDGLQAFKRLRIVEIY